MAGFTHSAFRRLVGELGGGYGALFTEMLNLRAIPRERIDTSPWLKRRPEDGPVIYQALARDTEGLEAAVSRIAEASPAAIDLNLACHAPFIRKASGGSGLFEDRERLSAVLHALREAWAGPLTVKIRLGRNRSDWADMLADRLALFERVGVDGVFVHTRFFEDGFKRRARHEWLPRIRGMTRLPLIANGEINGPECEGLSGLEAAVGLMTGRMLVVRPWLFAAWGRPAYRPDYADVWRRFCAYVMEDFQPPQALARIKMFAVYYARNFLFGHTLETTVRRATDIASAQAAGLAFIERNPAVCREPSLAGL